MLDFITQGTALTWGDWIVFLLLFAIIDWRIEGWFKKIYNRGRKNGK